MKVPSVSQGNLEGNLHPQQLVLGIDGGGTKTVAWLARFTPSSEPEIIGQGLAPSCNIRAIGREKALENLNSAIDAAWLKAGLDCHSVDSAVLALAGASTAEVQEQVAAWAEQRSLAARLDIVHDAKAVLEVGTPEGWGIALVAGTGSVAFGKNSESRTAVSGGWGYWFGDEGSAFGLGQAALRAASQSADGRGPSTQLLPAIINRLGVNEPRDILPALSVAGDVRQAIAELAVLVSHAADEQDPAARKIVLQAGRDLAELVKSTANQLSLGNEFPLALAGGVLCGSSTIREHFLQSLSEASFQPTTVQLVSDPVSGCVKMACAALQTTE